MESKRRGFTIVELLVAAAILGLFLALVGHAVVLAYRTHKNTSVKATDFRAATVAVDRLARELRSSDRIYMPDPTGPPFDTYGTCVPASPPLIFRAYGETGAVTLGYSYDNLADTVTRHLYRPDFDPAISATQVATESRIVARNVRDFRVTHLDPTATNGVPFFQLEMEVSSVKAPIMLEVRVKSL